MAGLPELREALGIEELHRDLLELRAEVARLQPNTRPAWYNLRAACELKGVSYNTVKSRSELQPGGGQPDALLGGRRCWKRETVEAWLAQVDSPQRKGGDRG